MENYTYSKNTIKEAIEYIQAGIVPDGLSAAARYRFRNRFDNKRYKISEDGKLLLDDKPVISEEETDEALRLLYNHSETGRDGVKSFFDNVRQYYSGISRSTVEQFLQRQRTYQTRKPTPPDVVQPIVTKRPKDIFELDLVIMDRYTWKNNGYSYIMNIIDHFSKMAWSFALKTREHTEIVKHIEDLFNQGHVPKVFHWYEISDVNLF